MSVVPTEVAVVATTASTKPVVEVVQTSAMTPPAAVAAAVVVDPSDRSKWTQAQWQAEMAKVESEARKEGANKTKKEAEEKAAVEQGKFKELYEAEKVRAESLVGIEAKMKVYAARISESIDATIKDWPSEAKVFDPGNADVEARLEWLKKAEPAAKRMLAGRNTSNEGGNRTGTVSPAVASGDGKNAGAEALKQFNSATQYAIPGAKK